MEQLKKVLSKLLKSVPQYDEKMAQFEVYEAWPKVVGSRVARHSWPVKLFDDGVLLVAASSSAWLQSLRFLESEIIAKYERELKKKRVKALRLKMETQPRS